ncbi:hemerythrin domain-containing protein [Streptomyces aidingensis]|uniref:Rho termination factor, N-terminal domain n=1 Tax=Streptomyces aidingensis TaxID=910347 RepID=A0A1I1SKI5_9ACTN|nr:hemerythrin domain-containing protein [Streptomyces aidingensis]SFD46977.1 Rho termination factor, N-terminal domain [Streptomyces aidingensis]
MADVIDLITRDHRRVEELFEQLRDGGDRAALMDEVARLLIAHSRAEEERVYPLIAKEVPGEAEEVRHSEAEHQEAEELIHRLLAAGPDSGEFDDLLGRLVEAVTEHVEKEESEVLPALREAVAGDRLAELAEEFGERREEALEEYEPAAGGAGDSGATRDELYEQAREHDIPGRSKMNKDDLARAVQEEETGD